MKLAVARRVTSILLMLAAMSATLPVYAAEVNIYSARIESLIKPLLAQFTEQTGIKVNLVTGDADALLKRLEMEGRNSPADLLVTTDVGRLHQAEARGVLQTVDSEILNEHIPVAYRDPEGYWFGLSLRARVIAYARDRVTADELSTYEALADENWRGRICIRSSSNVYNQSLVASLIAHHGVDVTQDWAGGLVKNFARSPQGGDRDQISAVAAGQCDLAVVNTYYIAGMLASPKQNEVNAAMATAVFWPNQEGRGAHVNISGAGVTKAAKNRNEAIKLLEFMLSDEAQRWYADQNHEYPVKAGIPVSNLLEQWGEFKADDLNLGTLGDNNAEAVRIMDRAGWR